MSHFLRLCLFVGLMISSGNALSQGYPSGPVKLVLSNSAGSAPDILARLLADRLSKALGQQVIVENKPGGDAVVGAVHAARAPADGYTLFLGINDSLVVNRFRVKSLPYDPDKDFTLIANLIDSAPFTVTVHPSVPAKTFGELVEFSKANPGKVSAATSVGVSDMLAQLINKHTNANIVAVPYRVNPQAVQDTVSGVVQVVLVSLASVDQFVKSGQLRLLAISGAKRFPSRPDVPTIAETYPGVIIDTWFALVGPAGIPQDIVKRLNTEVEKIVKEPDFIARMAQFGFVAGDAMTPQALAKRMQTDTELWRKIAKDINMEPR